jgi:NADH-quinone oxidoreductase subunit J
VAWLFGFPAMLTIGILLAWVVVRRNPTNLPVAAGAAYGSPMLIAEQLFRPYLLPFEVTSVLVLIAIMGAVVLARKED